MYRRNNTGSTAARRNIRKFCLEMALRSPHTYGHGDVVKAAGAFEDYICGPLPKKPARKRGARR